ncbi:VanZ family protein [Streptomyces sp. BBFR2]|uniref:VanZ family protein n=1 Tax=Streptomyces sp. BBFR2 TaxID=3372854 RepID=UPI0037DA4E6E
MTGAYLLPLNTAAMLFPALALFLSVPVAIVLYRRHGIMTRWRTLSIFAFVYFAVSALCLVVVPLPSGAVDVCQAFPTFRQPQWTPGMFVADMWKESHHQVSFDALILHNSAFWQTVFNLLLLLPLGIFVRLHFRRGLLAATLAGFGASLFFELTQFTGLWGIYPCPYRLFAVDDLLANAAGASLGWFVVAPLARFLPELDTLDDRALAADGKVPFGRRLVAMLLDLSGLVALGLPVTFAVFYLGMDEEALLMPLALIVLWFVVVPWLIGATPGKRVLLLRLTTRDGGRPGLGALALRAGLLALPPVFPVLSVIVFGLWLAGAGVLGNELGVLAVAAVLGISSLFSVGLVIWSVRGARRHPEGLGRHEIWSGVINTPLPHGRARKQKATGAAGESGGHGAGARVSEAQPAGTEAEGAGAVAGRAGAEAAETVSGKPSEPASAKPSEPTAGRSAGPAGPEREKQAESVKPAEPAERKPAEPEATSEKPSEPEPEAGKPARPAALPSPAPGPDAADAPGGEAKSPTGS